MKINLNTRRRIGLLVPSTDIAMEYDIWSHIPSNTTIHVSRMYLEATTVAGEEKMLAEELEAAAYRVASVKPELVIFGCTSAAALRGLDGDAKISETISDISQCKCVTVVQAVLSDIRAFKPQSLFVFTPYVPDVTQRLKDTFLQAKVPVTGVAGLDLGHDLDIGSVPPEKIKALVSEQVLKAKNAPDSVFISCTTFRAFEAARDLEDNLGIPVFTSNRSASNVIDKFIREEKV